MKCPYCSNEMTLGYIEGFHTDLMWIPDGKKRPFGGYRKRGISMKKNKIIMASVSLCVALLVGASLLINMNTKKASTEFIDIMDRLYTEGDVVIENKEEKDVTDAFVLQYQTAYEAGDYDSIYSAFTNTYTASWNS